MYLSNIVIPSGLVLDQKKKMIRKKKEGKEEEEMMKKRRRTRKRRGYVDQYCRGRVKTSVLGILSRYLTSIE